MRPQPFDAPFCPAPGLDPTNLNRSGLLHCDVALRVRRSCPFKSRPCAPLDAARPRALICALVSTWDSSARCWASSGGAARVHSRRRLIWTRTAVAPLLRHRGGSHGLSTRALQTCSEAGREENQHHRLSVANLALPYQLQRVRE